MLRKVIRKRERTGAIWEGKEKLTEKKGSWDRELGDGQRKKERKSNIMSFMIRSVPVKQSSVLIVKRLH